ncbi:MAG TPA: 30S ribosomal protein S4 [Treponemataceae bacterium]|nr:30S ribosomal protein S4 [Treponemataceae bacterium]
MATRRNPRFKECRRLGVNTCGHPKAMKKVQEQGFKRRRKPSEYSLQLTEKQKIKAYYGIFERQLHNTFVKAKKKTDMKHGDALLVMLESRLDNIVYRAGFANSIRMARQLVSHGHMRVNGQKVDIPSYELKPGDVVALRDKSKGIENFKTTFLSQNVRGLEYVSRDEEKLRATYTRYPERKEIPVEINMQLVVELYSR